MTAGKPLIDVNRSTIAEQAVVTSPLHQNYIFPTQKVVESDGLSSAMPYLNSNFPPVWSGASTGFAASFSEQRDKTHQNVEGNGFYNVTLSMSAFVMEQMSAFSLKTIDSSSTEPARWMIDTIRFMAQTTSAVYQDIIDRCDVLLENIDIDDAESRESASELLIEILKSVRTLAVVIFRRLIGMQKNSPDLTSFILNDIMLRSDLISEPDRMEIIKMVLGNSKGSVRLAAIEALDSVGSTEAQRLLSSIYPDQSRLGKDLITASLSSGR